MAHQCQHLGRFHLDPTNLPDDIFLRSSPAFVRATTVPQRLWGDAHLQDAVLNDYLNGSLVPFQIAKKHNLTVDQLINFVRSDLICARLRDLKRFAQDRAATLAVLHRPAAISRLA